MFPQGRSSRNHSASSSFQSEGMSTYSPSFRKRSIEDGDLYIAGQSFVPVVNNPGGLHRSNSGNYGILSWSASAVDRAWAEAAPPPPSSLHREISYSDFDEYRQRIGTMMDRYLYRRMSIQQENARRLSVVDPEGCGYLRGEGLVQALRQVPALYFHEDFSLTRPDTFTQVIRGENPAERNATLEALSNSLDVVETELLNEIAARSDSFFEAAESLQDLQKSMGDTLFQIQRLQVQGHHIDEGMCSRAEQIQSLSRQKRNMEATLDVLKIIETVTHAQDTVHLLLLAHDYPSALDLIDDLRQQYEDTSLSGMVAMGVNKLRCLKHIPDALEVSIVSVRASLIGELLELMNWDEGESVVRSVAAKALGESGRSGTNSFDMTQTEFMNKKHKLKQILTSLSRTGSVSGSFSEIIPHAVSRFNTSLRNLLEILVPNFVEVSVGDDSPTHEASPIDHLQWIDHDMFVVLLEAFYSVSAACIGHYRQLGEMFVEATDVEKVLQHRMSVDRGRMDLGHALVDTLQARWNQLFQSRNHIHQMLTLEQLKQLLQIHQKCTDLVIKANVKMTDALGHALQNYCKTALKQLHAENASRLREVLETEDWKPSFVHQQTQNVLSQMFFPEPLSETHDPKCQVLRLGHVEYRVAHVVWILAAMICEAIQHGQDFSDSVTETTRHVMELITVFNKRSCQLVLGAQAMQVNGLKSITAKHLALCSQSILFFIDLFPHLSEALLQPCSEVKRTLLRPELDRLKQDLSMHLEGIHSKLVGIMKERLHVGIQMLQSEIKNVKPSEEDYPPSQAAQHIAKQLRILTQVLTPILHERQITEICSLVAQIFSDELGLTFRQIVDANQLFDIPSQTEDDPKEACPHPLEAANAQKNAQNKEEERCKALCRKRQLASDGNFLVEILASLPAHDPSKSYLDAFNRIVQQL